MTKLWKSDKRKYSNYTEMETKLMSFGFSVTNIQKAL